MFSTNTSFTVFDLETTGLHPSNGDRIVEIGAVRIEKGVIQEKDTFCALVNPQRKISPEASRIHKISDEDVIGSPTIEEVLPQFLDFAKGTVLVAHNAEFDLSFLEAEKEMCWGYIEVPECLCTLNLSRTVFPHEYRHNLDIVAERLKLKDSGSRHRALPDVLLTAQAFLKLIGMGNIHSLEELRKKACPGAARRPVSA